MRFIKKSCLGLMLAGLVIPSFASADIVTNLQEHWAMDDDITSDSGTHDGTFSSLDGAGPNFVAGQFGQAVDLERDNVEYIEVQNSVTDFDYVGGSISVSCWINFEDDQSNWQTVISMVREVLGDWLREQIREIIRHRRRLCGQQVETATNSCL